MSPDRVPLFCDTDLAERIERVEAELIARASEAAQRRREDAAGLVIPVAVVVDGVAHPDTQGMPSHETFPRDAVERAERDFAAAGVARYVALRDGVIAGGGSFRMAEGVAQLTRAATAPAHRGRGIQTALLSARLADAASAGCDIAVVTAQPASKSQRNVQRRGFDLLYTRAVLVKQP